MRKPNPRIYPLDVRELSEFEGGPLGWYSKGHHAPADFLAAVEWRRCEDRVGLDERLDREHVRHEYWRVVPVPSPYRDGAWTGIFLTVAGPGPGAFPVTVVE